MDAAQRSIGPPLALLRSCQNRPFCRSACAVKPLGLVAAGGVIHPGQASGAQRQLEPSRPTRAPWTERTRVRDARTRRERKHVAGAAVRDGSERPRGKSGRAAGRGGTGGADPPNTPCVGL
jgi:hypothetical protein